MEIRLPRLSRPYAGAASVDALGRGIVTGVFLPFAGVIARRLGASPEQIAVVGSAPFLGFLFASLVCRLSGYLAHSQVLFLMRAITALALAAFAFVARSNGFVILAVIVMAVSSLSLGATTDLMRTHLRAPVRASVMAVQRIIATVLSIACAAAAGWAFDIDQASYRWLFPLAGLACILFSIPTLRLPVRYSEERQRSRPRLLEELAVLREDRLFLGFLVVFFIGTLGEKLGMAITPLYFADYLDMRYEDVGLAVGIFGPMAAIAGYLLWARLIRRVEPLTVITVAMLVKAVRPLLWAIAGTVDAPLPWLIGGEIGFRFTVTGLELGALMTVTGMARPGKGPLYTGLHYLLMGIRGVLGPIIGYGLFRAGIPFPGIYVIMGGIVLVGGVALIPVRLAFVRRRKAQS